MVELKIALINFTHADTETGGVETRYRLIRQALEEAGHECVMIATKHATFDEVMCDLSPCLMAISDSAVGFPTLIPTITIFGNAWQGVLACEDNEHIKQIVKREQKWHVKNDTVRVAVSKYMRDSEMRASEIVASHTIPNPADIERFAGFTRAPVVPPVVLWAGPRINVKNYQMMEVISMEWPLKYRECTIQWDYVCKDNSPRGLPEMTQALLRASVVVCTSHAEGCSNTLMEAISADVPIVTSKTGLFWNWWDERLGCRIENIDNVNEWLEAIQAVLRNPDRYHPREVALERGLDYKHWALRWQALVEDYEWQVR